DGLAQRALLLVGGDHRDAGDAVALPYRVHRRQAGGEPGAGREQRPDQQEHAEPGDRAGEQCLGHAPPPVSGAATVARASSRSGLSNLASRRIQANPAPNRAATTRSTTWPSRLPYSATYVGLKTISSAAKPSEAPSTICTLR